MKYDHTEYNGGAPSRSMPERPSTKAELVVWMNKLSISVGAGVKHWLDTETDVIHFETINVDGKVAEIGSL